MKKNIVCALLAFVLLFCLASCSKDKEEVTTESVSVTETQPQSAGTVDLTTLSSTMVYSEVYNMLSNPDEYVGKTVIMQGPFSIYQTDQRNYYACIIKDATACCQQGLEFVVKDDLKYPQDYPEIGTEIKVTGTFNTYYEGENRYAQLENASMTVL